MRQVYKLPNGRYYRIRDDYKDPDGRVELQVLITAEMLCVPVDGFEEHWGHIEYFDSREIVLETLCLLARHPIDVEWAEGLKTNEKEEEEEEEEEER